MDPVETITIDSDDDGCAPLMMDLSPKNEPFQNQPPPKAWHELTPPPSGDTEYNPATSAQDYIRFIKGYRIPLKRDRRVAKAKAKAMIKARAKPKTSSAVQLISDLVAETNKHNKKVLREKEKQQVHQTRRETEASQRAELLRKQREQFNRSKKRQKPTNLNTVAKRLIVRLLPQNQREVIAKTKRNDTSWMSAEPSDHSIPSSSTRREAQRIVDPLDDLQTISDDESN